MMFAQEAVFAKSNQLDGYTDQLRDLVQQAIEERVAMHEVEERALRVLLELGRATLELLLDGLGPGDIGGNR